MNPFAVLTAAAYWLLGALVGLGFGATSLAVAYLWESKPGSSFAIDASYHTIGCTVCGAILSVWR